MDTVEVDGSYGEGGGQILRTAMALSIVTRRPTHVTKIRAGREVPGLRPQHLAAVEILRDISGGHAEGARVGSTDVAFTPGEARRGTLTKDLGTAASITLVLQAVVPAVSLAGSSLSLELTGGTDVPWSPCFDYLSTVMKEAFHRVGVDFSASASRRGYYPRGGGRVTASVEPCSGPAGIKLVAPPADRPVRVMSRCGALPRHVAERQAQAASTALSDAGLRVGEVTVAAEDSDSPGSSVVIASIGPDGMLGADSLGARGRLAEDVGRAAASRFLGMRSGGSCIDSFLADMVAPILCFAKSESKLRIPEVSEHLRTSLHVASLFGGHRYSVEEGKGFSIVTIGPAGLMEGSDS
jgi:RNA 3'-phosphate cyclase